MKYTTPPRIPGLVVAGTGSNAGKTLTTLALLCALRARGLRVHAAKSGPDFIDAAFHAALTGAPAANLDVWMCRETRSEQGQRPLRRIPQARAARPNWPPCWVCPCCWRSMPTVWGSLWRRWLKVFCGIARPGPLIRASRPLPA